MEHLECIPSNSFDAAAMVNVLYALADPLKCLRDVNRMLRKGGVLGLSTTHRESDLDSLLNCIETQLREDGKLVELAEDWNAVLKVNRRLEKTVVHQHSRDDVKDMVQTAGFEIIKENPSTYCDAVMSLHVRKRA
jgi:ubiquinone/menaquinone biosynthesis C-methylase UbiE